MNEQTEVPQSQSAEAGELSSKGLKKLKKRLQKKAAREGEDFPTGTVIRWKLKDRYDFAALKVSNGYWYTTTYSSRATQASEVGVTIGKRLTFAGLLRTLEQPEVTGVLIATEWTSLGG